MYVLTGKAILLWQLNDTIESPIMDSITMESKIVVLVLVLVLTLTLVLVLGLGLVLVLVW